jgi:hypothetical protein
MKNLIIKTNQINMQNKRLKEKSEKVKSMKESLRLQGSSEEEINEIEQMLTTDEINRLNSISEQLKRIELAQIQLEEIIFMFEIYFYCHDTSFSVVNKK